MVGRNQSIDLIKIIAALMVVALHLNVDRSFSGYQYCNLAYLAGVAIPLFFMVSGYLMAGKAATVKYSLHKIKNILILTGIICLLYDLTVFVVKGSFAPNFPVCFLQGGVWWHFWYFGSMIAIYAILPLLARIINNRYLIWFIVLLGLISLTFWIMDLYNQFEKHNIRQTFRMWYFLYYFLIGAYINKNNFDKHFPVILVPVSAALYFISMKYTSAGGIEYHFGSPLCTFYAVSLFLCFSTRHFENRTVPFLSELILPTYVFHVLIIKKLIIPYVSSGIETSISINYYIAFAIEYIITAIITLLTAKLISLLPMYKRVFKL